MKKLFFVALILCEASFAQTNVARMLSGVNAQTGTSYTFVASDVTKVVTFNNLGSVSATLLAGSTTGFGAGSVFTAVNLGAGTVTIICSGCTINGSASIQVAQNQSVSLYGDGANYVSASGSSTGSANFASPPPLGNTTPNSVSATSVQVAANGFLMTPDLSCLFHGSDPSLDQFSDVNGVPTWITSGLICQSVLLYTPLGPGVNPLDKQVPAWDAATGAFTIQPQTGGNPAFSALTSATNSTAAMRVGTGASLAPTGTGAITATALLRSTFASLPVAPPAGTTYEVTDATVLGSCGGGGGSQLAMCSWDGVSAWTPVGDGAGTAIGPSFNVRNYGCIADDVTDNATCFANLATAVNAYAGSGVAEVTCDMGPGDKAYLTSAGMNFTVPTYVKGGCTIDVKSTFSGCAIRMGATGLAAFATGQIPPYTVEGLTFTGGAGGATGVCVEPYISQSRIARNYFRNFGTSATTSWAANALSPNNEVHMTDNFIWIDDATTGRNGLKCVDTSALGSNTCVIAHNTINSAQAPGFTGPCGGVGIQVGGAHDTLIANDIYGFNTDIRIDNSSSGNTVYDTLIIGGALDSNACANGTVQAAIQLGAAGNVTNVIRYVEINGVFLTGRTGLHLFDTAGDNTSGLNLAANVKAYNNQVIGGTLNTFPITAAAAYGLNSNNYGFGSGTAPAGDTGSKATPTVQDSLIALARGSAPATPGSGMVRFFANSSTAEAGLCHQNEFGFTYCYPYGPLIQTGTSPGTAIAAQTCQDTNVTVTNSFAAGQTVVATPSSTLGANWANIVWNAYISANNTVTLHLCNPTAGSLTPAAQTFYIKVIQ